MQRKRSDCYRMRSWKRNRVKALFYSFIYNIRKKDTKFTDITAIMIKRSLQTIVAAKLKDNKAIILLGPRQAGKSTLLQQMQAQFKHPIAWWNGDETDIRTLLENPSSTQLKSLIGNNKTVVIDEAQRIENIGICIKLITDNIKEVKVIATGSSAFELANKIKRTTNRP